MESYNDKLKNINSKFEYISDKKKYHFYDVWTQLKAEDGKLLGDCEDYALTVKKLIGGTIYFCKHSGK